MTFIQNVTDMNLQNYKLEKYAILPINTKESIDMIIEKEKIRLPI